MGIVDTTRTFAAALAKTRDSLLGRISRIVKVKSKIDHEIINELEEILLGSDVGSQTTGLIIRNIERRVQEEKYEDTAGLQKLLKDEVVSLLHLNGGEKDQPFVLPVTQRPYVVLVVGVNGAGKTTTIGKLAYHYRKAEYRVLIGAADTFRAAANEQLEIWAKRAGVEVIQQAQGADPAAVAYDTVSSAVAKNADAVLIDTAGRLHTKMNLMKELRKISRVVANKLPGAPHEVLLVLDASTGQNGLQQARQFTEAVNVTGIALTKLDGTAKGGIVLAISNEMRVPVKYIGVGEDIDDLQPFDRKAFVDALFQSGQT